MRTHIGDVVDALNFLLTTSKAKEAEYKRTLDRARKEDSALYSLYSKRKFLYSLLVLQLRAMIVLIRSSLEAAELETETEE
jgi:hypothetical protein